jgi:hypothetical protein
MGEILHLPFTYVEPWPDVIGQLQKQGFRCLAFTPAFDAVPLRAVQRAPNECITSQTAEWFGTADADLTKMSCEI